MAFLTLEQTILHCEAVADEQRTQAQFYFDRVDFDKSIACAQKASEHKQLADWLKCLKEIMDSGSCNDCEYGKKGYCGIEPKAGELVRYNCYQYKRKKQGGGNDQR